jgi:hypothetical protein
MGWMTEVQFQIGAVMRFFFIFTTTSRPALGSTQHPVQGLLGPLIPGVKQPGYEADHLPTAVARVKNPGAVPPLPQYVIMLWCLVKQDTSSWHSA